MDLIILKLLSRYISTHRHCLKPRLPHIKRRKLYSIINVLIVELGVLFHTGIIFERHEGSLLEKNTEVGQNNARLDAYSTLKMSLQLLASA